jgi:hypothetical protein
MWESQKHYCATQIRGVDWRSCQAYNVCVMAPCEGWEGAWGKCIHGEVLRLFV